MKTKKKEEDFSEYQSYARDVVEGKIVAGQLLIKACQRYLDWFSREDVYFSPKKASNVVKFIEYFHLWTGKWNGKPFKLLPFQKFIVYSIFGFYWKENDERVIRKVYVQVARKNAKTMLISAIQAWMLIGEGENGAQCYTIANSTQQASIAFGFCKNLIKQLDPKGKHFRYYRDQIKFGQTDSILRVLSSDTSRLDGLAAYSAICDEFHASDAETYSILRTSQASLTNSLIMVISTAGLNLDCACKEMRDMCVEILNGTITDDSQLAIIYELDPEDDYRDEKVWIKANPSLGDIVKVDYLREQVREAQNNTSLETSIKTKNFDMWVATSQTWLPSDVIINAQQNIPDEFWEDKTIYMGMDLAAVSDLTALSMMCEHEDKYYFKTFYFLPQETVKTSPNRELYANWMKKNYLNVTEGNVTDYDAVKLMIDQIAKRCDIIASVGYDSWNATHLVSQLTQDGYPMLPISQSIGNLNRPTKELTRLMLSGRVIYDHNPITRFCFANSAIKEDNNGNQKVVKGGSISGKIDGVVSMIMALSAYQGGNSTQSEIFSLQY